MEIYNDRNQPTQDSISIYSNGSLYRQNKEQIDCKHSDKDIYCSKHNKMLCRNCSVKLHRSCDGQPLTEVAHECGKETLEKLVAEIDALKEKLALTINELRNDHSILHQEKQTAIQKIKDVRCEMSRQLDAFENEALHNLDILFSEYQVKTEAKLRVTEQALTFHSENLTELSQCDNCDELSRITKVKDSERIVQEAKEALHRHKVYLPDVVFTPDFNLTQLMEEATTLGECKINIKRDPKVLYEVVDKREVKITRDKDVVDCNITGSVRLSNGYTLLTDRTNKKLIRLVDLPDSVSMKDQIKFPSEPWGVCAINEKEAAVSFPEETRNIRFISVGKRLKITRFFKLRHTCRALAFNGEELIVTDQGVFVYVYALDGTLRRKFSENGHVESKLTDFHSIAINANLIVLTDWVEGLIAFDIDGTLVWKYKDAGIKRASGLCFDETGSILACGSQSLNVIHINREGKKIGEVANTANGIEYPTTLCFDEGKSTIFVAQQEANVVLLRVR